MKQIYFLVFYIYLLVPSTALRRRTPLHVVAGLQEVLKVNKYSQSYKYIYGRRPLRTFRVGEWRRLWRESPRSVSENLRLNHSINVTKRISDCTLLEIE